MEFEVLPTSRVRVRETNQIIVVNTRDVDPSVHELLEEVPPEKIPATDGGTQKVPLDLASDVMLVEAALKSGATNASELSREHLIAFLSGRGTTKLPL